MSSQGATPPRKAVDTRCTVTQQANIDLRKHLGTQHSSMALPSHLDLQPSPSQPHQHRVTDTLFYIETLTIEAKYTTHLEVSCCFGFYLYLLSLFQQRNQPRSPERISRPNSETKNIYKLDVLNTVTKPFSDESYGLKDKLFSECISSCRYCRRCFMVKAVLFRVLHRTITQSYDLSTP